MIGAVEAAVGWTLTFELDRNRPARRLRRRHPMPRRIRLTMMRSAIIAALAAFVLAGFARSTAQAGPLDGLAGAAVGFALGAMVVGSQRAYAPRSYRGARRVVVYRQAPRRHAAVRGRPAGPRGAVINTAADPFAGSSGLKPIPVAGR
ncbi:hypothetical protein [uncultured Methylobacterium sp.]|jgi:ABC-type amino acid transport substrate-binding protein|uniref:hypothetical protein n=1 Tax=uncultured Methylobacterium sp. TaxID=157278 RepID=UPI0026250E14|nr:hypothetical protein [uncultured Methylobacterium sp.]